jgi:methyl-accepting chemotaxis protein
VFLGTSLIGVIGYLISLLIAVKRSISVGMYISMLTAIILIAGTSTIFGTSNSGIGTMLWIPLQAGLLSRHRVRDIIVSTAVIVLVMTGLVLAEAQFHLFTAWIALETSYLFNLYIWANLAAMIAGGIVVFVNESRRAQQEAEDKASQLAESLQLLQQTNLLSKELANSMAVITSELSATSHQQAVGATQQAGAVTEATTSLEELGQTALNIATNATTVATAAEQCLALAHEVEKRSEFLHSLTEHGQASVEAVVNVSETVSNHIEGLVQRLFDLTERSKKIGDIIGLMRAIADETHLLALNAAIESAGGDDTTDNQGRRFGVIASEVKNLADRSLQSAKEVQVVITEIQNAIITAVTTAEEGKKDTHKAVTQAYASGQVIQDLGQAVTAAVQSSRQIVAAVSHVGTITEEITFATKQQNTASQQIVITMHTVQQVAQDSASSAAQVTATVSRVEQLAFQLEKLLESQNLRSA